MQGRYEDIPKYEFANPYKIYLARSRGRKGGPVAFVSTHWHEYIELLYIVNGNLEVFTGGITHHCGKGDMIVINSCEAHATRYRTDSKTRYFVIQFDPSLLNLSNAMYQVKYVLPFTSRNDSNRRYFSAGELKGTAIPRLVRELYKEYNGRNYAYELAVQSRIMEIFLYIVRIWNRKGIMTDFNFPEKKEDLRMINKVYDFVAKHFHEDISVKDAADMCHLSYSYFSSKFKSISGRSFKEYLQFVRLKEAERYLVTSDMNITEIACSIGFSSTSYFIQVFRGQKGISPKQFRNRLRGHPL